MEREISNKGNTMLKPLPPEECSGRYMERTTIKGKEWSDDLHLQTDLWHSNPLDLFYTPEGNMP